MLTVHRVQVALVGTVGSEGGFAETTEGGLQSTSPVPAPMDQMANGYVHFADV